MSQCSICLKKVTLPHTLECKHIFCFICIKFSTLSNGSRCPMCRNEYDKHILDDVIIEDEDNDIKELDIKWYYAGRNDGYWQYDNVTTELLEESYQEWTKNNSNSSDLNYFPIYGTSEDSLLEHGLIPVAVGDINNFYYNFEEMYQYNHRNGAIRNIVRYGKDDNIDIIIKGIAGVKIKQKKYFDFIKNN